jgi:hypothetical protein
VKLSLGRSIQTLVAVAFGLGLLAFGIAGFAHIDSSERRIEAKLNSIRAGVIQPETLTVVKKYVNPGRSGLPHVVFSSARLPKVDISARRDFFNSVNPGQTIHGYYFPDGYFIPENHRDDTGAGKWFFLGVGVLVGGATLALARATTHSGPASGAAS